MRLAKLQSQFKVLYEAEPTIGVSAPGRVEIIGNHTDYNQGSAIGCAITQSTLGLFRKRRDQKIVIHSTSANSPIHQTFFSLDILRRDKKLLWANYPKAVVQELLKLGYPLAGADVLVDTNFPISGGLSSSAALELCLARGFLSLIGKKIKLIALAQACQRAENGELVQSPCGFLDQGTITFAQPNKMVLLNFSPPTKIKLIDAPLKEKNVSLIVAVDKTVKRELGTSGFPIRRKMCEEAFRILGLKGLPELSPQIFTERKNELPPLMRRRLEHVVMENQRVQDFVVALSQRNMERLGELFNQSGTSALDLFGLDEKTPELRFLMETAQNIDGVLGARNTGGGFSAVILTLVKTESLENFKVALQKQYAQKFGNKLEFINFTPSFGVTSFDLF